MSDIPAGVQTDGTRRVFFVPAVADENAITVAELEAGIDLSCYLTPDGWAPSGDEATVTDSRLCSTQDFELPGRETNSLTLRYTYNLNVPADDVARITLKRGTKGVIVNVLQHLEEDADPEAGAWYEPWPVTTGKQRPLPIEANSMDRIEQRMFVRGRVGEISKIVA